MLQATDEISVRLSAAEWNQVMAVLGEGPFRVVAPLLAKIRDQALAQDAPPPPMIAGNGEAAADVPRR